MREELGEESIRWGSIEQNANRIVLHRSSQMYSEQGLVDVGSEVQGEDVNKDVLLLEWYGERKQMC